MSKQGDLLKLLIPLISNYDYSTIKKVFEYVLNNEEMFLICKQHNDSFIKGIEGSRKKRESNKSNQDKPLFTNLERNKQTTLKSIKKTIEVKKIELKQVTDIIEREISGFQGDKLDSLEMLLEVLCEQDVDTLKKLQNSIIANVPIDNGANSLENWSNLIIQEGKRN